MRRYTGGETPTLNRMGGADFEKQKARVRSAVQEIAQELVVLYRRRLASPGHAFAPDTPWQREIEEAFPYEETPDQLKAIDDVKSDMERPIPMDRLVCGDVGFGKTEVAVRAAFKAVQDGKQVAVLVPTTLLASQHGQTFRDRFANYPVRVEVLSRFLTTKEQSAVVAQGRERRRRRRHRHAPAALRRRALPRPGAPRHRRGAALRRAAQGEDQGAARPTSTCLTLSATPIPRTLELSLTGIRDLSLVNTPPEDRQPILTYVGEYDDRAVAEAIRRELLREGQVFFVHNQVKDIEFIAEHIRELVPEARIAIAHGQMDEARLERVVLDFWDRKYDVLVCTTIVESGLDMPMVNTLVVDRADRLGLAQMYQLRGRVGRRGQRAYAYLLHPRDQVLSEEAYERLKTIGEFTDLGSGFKIAMRDLEIRGAGNLLGGAQSGHIAAVGFDLYCQLVTEAVGELMGERPPEPVEVTIDLPVDANLPREYVARDDVRMEAYRRLAAVTDPTDVDDVRAEWEDRYGAPPPSAEALLAVARLRAECVRLGVRSVVVTGDAARIRGLRLKDSQKVRLNRLAPGSKVSTEELFVPLRVPADESADGTHRAVRRADPSRVGCLSGKVRSPRHEALCRSTRRARGGRRDRHGFGGARERRRPVRLQGRRSGGLAIRVRRRSSRSCTSTRCSSPATRARPFRSRDRCPAICRGRGSSCGSRRRSPATRCASLDERVVEADRTAVGYPDTASYDDVPEDLQAADHRRPGGAQRVPARRRR